MQSLVAYSKLHFVVGPFLLSFPTITLTRDDYIVMALQILTFCTSRQAPSERRLSFSPPTSYYSHPHYPAPYSLYLD